MGRTFAEVFDPRANALNLIRLLLAVTVIFWHSFPLSGNDIEWAPLRQVFAEVGVDGFFAISGYLIVASWVRDPNWGRYLRARALRILPAFWVCLIVTGFIIAPVTARVFGWENVTYVIYNGALRIFQEGIYGTPLGVPYEGVWNGSMWTLWWEFLCYLGVMLLGVLGLLRRRWTTTVLFAGLLLVAIAVEGGVIQNWYVIQASRFGLMFLAGALIWQWRSRLPVNPIALSVAGVVLAGSMFLPNYRLVAALPLAYLVMVAGAAIKDPRFRLRNDISYGVYIYAFPAQQALAYWGATSLSVPVYAVLATLLTVPLAAASWFLIEKPAMRLKGNRPQVAPAEPAAAF